MSAFICETAMFQYLVAAIRRFKAHPRADLPDELGQTLVDANYASVNGRYGKDDDAPEFRYEHAFDEIALDPLQVIKSAHCLEYQSCELESWEGTEACRIIRRLISRAATHLPGWEKAVWGVPDRVSGLKHRRIG